MSEIIDQALADSLSDEIKAKLVLMYEAYAIARSMTRIDSEKKKEAQKEKSAAQAFLLVNMLENQMFTNK